jgi:chemotaxis protein methyltransferase CheR
MSTPATTLEREFVFTERDFAQVQKLIRERAGISLSAAKYNMVYSRLSRRLRACGLTTFREYLERLETPGSPELELFTNSLTTNLTAFFREAHHFPMLADHLRSRPRGETGILWCSAASTGEEPYSMAITACEAFDSLRPPVRIIASDIDTQVLATAAAGVYPAERIEQLSPERCRRFFLRGTGAQAGKVRVRPELQALIDFRPLNLLAPDWPIPRGLAAIFCRNVMIYFDRPTQLAILQRFAPLLGRGGLVFAGHSESFAHANGLFRLRGKTVYERPPAAATA